MGRSPSSLSLVGTALKQELGLSRLNPVLDPTSLHPLVLLIVVTSTLTGANVAAEETGTHALTGAGPGPDQGIQLSLHFTLVNLMSYTPKEKGITSHAGYLTDQLVAVARDQTGNKNL